MDGPPGSIQPKHAQVRDALDHWWFDPRAPEITSKHRRLVADTLWYALENPSCELDLRTLDFDALITIPAHLMRSVAQALSGQQAPVTHLILPPGAQGLPPWLSLFENLDRLTSHCFKGNRATAAKLAGELLPLLRTLDLTGHAQFAPIRVELDQWVFEPHAPKMICKHRRLVADTLWYALENPSCELDLHKLDFDTLVTIPAHLMRSVAQALSPPVTHLILPPGAQGLPPWLPLFENLDRLTSHSFKGNRATAVKLAGEQLPLLRSLDLTDPMGDLTSKLSAWVGSSKDVPTRTARAQLANLLIQAANHPSSALALQGASADIVASDEFAIFMNVLACIPRHPEEPDISELMLPARMPHIPAWIGHFKSLRKLGAKKFSGVLLDLRGCPQWSLELDVTGFTDSMLTMHCFDDTIVRRSTQDPPHVLFKYDRASGELTLSKLLPQVDLNSAAVFKDDPARKIMCRYIAIWMLKAWRDDPNAHSNLVYARDLTRLVGTETEELFGGVCTRLRENYVVAHAEWGKFVCRCFTEMEKQEKKLTERSLAVLTVTHILSVRMRIADGKYIVDLIDSNRTSDLKTVESGQIEGFADCNFESMLEPYLFKDYFEGEHGIDRLVCVSIWPDPTQPIPKKVPDDRFLSFEFAGDPAQWHPNLFVHAYSGGAYDFLARAFIVAVANGKLSHERAKMLVTVTRKVLGYERKQTPFSLATYDKSGASTRKIGTLLLSLTWMGVLDSNELKKLLQAADSFGNTLILIPRSKQDSGAIRAFAQLLREAYQTLDKSGAPLLSRDDVEELWSGYIGELDEWTIARLDEVIDECKRDLRSALYADE